MALPQEGKMKRSGNLFNIILLLTVLVVPAFNNNASAALPNAYFYTVRQFRAAELPDETGLAYDDASGKILALSPAEAGRALQVRAFDRVLEDALENTTVALPVSDARSAVFDPASERLLIYQADGTLASLSKSAGWQPAESRSLNGMEGPRSAAPATVRGAALDPGTGILYLLDEQARTVTCYLPGQNAPLRKIDLAGLGETQPRGLALNPNNGHFYTADAAGERVFEIDQKGQAVAVLDLAPAGLRVTGGMVFAPSGDLTDDPAEYSLYIASAHPSGSGHQIAELTLTAPPQVLEEESPMASLVRTINAYAWEPSSPDTSGISYWPQKGSYLVSDGEVEGYPDFTGDNLYQMTAGGTLQRSYSAMRYSDEPTGVAVNAENGEIYFSDDARRKVFVVNPGADGQLETADDRVTSFSTNNAAYKSTDPEGVGWGNGILYIVDGSNSQVFVLSPGANDRFDGVPPSGDDVLLRQFDTEALGIADPEGIDYNTQTNTLFIAGNNSRDVLIEVTSSGSPVRLHNIAALPAQNPAGIGIGPSSRGSAAYSIFMTDRGTDVIGSNTHDGRIFEIEVYSSAPVTPTHTPTSTPTPTPTVTSTPAPLFSPIYLPVIIGTADDVAPGNMGE